MSENLKLNPLNAEETHVIINKGTERPFTGEYENHFENGHYVCRQCEAPLYRSEDKFHSHCGWPSFDDEIEGAVRRVMDADGRRVEIVCARCDGHLGHVFEGERMTEKNTRHCVNSISMKFVDAENQDDEEVQTMTELKSAYFAAGCFWGVEHLMQQQLGVVSAVSGYMGGHIDNPSYQQVCGKNTGHLEVVKVDYDPNMVDFESLAKLFFEIHDPSQTDGQGPDKGPQYLSAIFYNDDHEKEISKDLIQQLADMGIKAATELRPIAPFWEAEDYHQDYYAKNGKTPYCHIYTPRFNKV